MAQPVSKSAVKINPDAYCSITVVWKSGLSYQVPCRGRRLQSHLTQCADNVWLQSFVPREITEAQYQLLMYGSDDEVVTKKTAKKPSKPVAKKPSKQSKKKNKKLQK